LTNYREFTNRQSGMYRITTMLDDVQAAQVIRACCDKKFCLKQRLWTVENLPGDAAAAKSLISCLEPCAILLEFARKAVRLEQEEKSSAALPSSDVASIELDLQGALTHPSPELREADFDSPANPRRLQLAIEKRRAAGIKLAKATEDE
jgi:hypothetical protein